MRKGQVFSLMEGIYSRGRYIGGTRKFRECKRVG